MTDVESCHDVDFCSGYTKVVSHATAVFGKSANAGEWVLEELIMRGTHGEVYLI